MHKHLPLGRNLPHLFANGIGGLAADVGVHLVEHQHRNFVLGGQHGFSANITRAISPEEAMARSGRAGSPGLGANWNSISSKPVPDERRCWDSADLKFQILTPRLLMIATSNLLCLKPRSPSCLADGLGESRNDFAPFGRQLLAGAPQFGFELLQSRR